MPTSRIRLSRLALVSAGAVALLAAQVALANDEVGPVYPETAPPEVEVTTHNAALLYHRVWMIMDRELQNQYQSTDGVISIAEGGAELLRENQVAVRAILKATRQDHADWDVEYEQGPEFLLPHLGKMRATARVLAADTIRCAQDGDAAGAAERIEAMYRSARHLKPDRVMISSMVGLAITNLANRLCVHLAEGGLLTPQAATSILRTFEGIDRDDPIGLRASVAMESDTMAEYFLTYFTGPDAGARIVELEAQSFGDEYKQRLDQLGALDGEALKEDVIGFRRFHEDALEVWDEPDAVGRIETMEDRVRRGEYGVIASVFAASLDRVRVNLDTFHDDFTKTQTALKTIANP